MRVGVPKEIKIQEHRVGLTPMAVREYTAAGHEVLVQAGAGAGIGAADAAYEAAGPPVNVQWRWAKIDSAATGGAIELLIRSALLFIGVALVQQLVTVAVADEDGVAVRAVVVVRDGAVEPHQPIVEGAPGHPLGVLADVEELIELAEHLPGEEEPDRGSAERRQRQHDAGHRVAMTDAAAGTHAPQPERDPRRPADRRLRRCPARRPMVSATSRVTSSASRYIRECSTRRAVGPHGRRLSSANNGCQSGTSPRMAGSSGDTSTLRK